MLINKAKSLFLAVTAVMITDVSALAEFSIAAENEYVAHSDTMLYLRRSDSTVVMLPKDYVLEYGYSGSLFNASLIDGESLVFEAIVEMREDMPDDMPTFSSYKFANKYNSQVFTDAEGITLNDSTINVEVGCIGKWLTASFQFTADGTKAWVNGVRQYSKKTRQSFAEPVTYELTNSYWQTLKIKKGEDNTYTREYVDYAKKVTVDVDFLSDHPTSEYGVPRIDITLSDTTRWGSGNWIGMNGKTHYEDATIVIDGAGVYPDMDATPIQIKGRGNTSWSSSYTSKNPYHFKFEEKHKPLGMKNGRHWILLSNKQTSSMTTNAMGHKVGNLLETAGTNHIVPVELHINGSYRGSYNLTERIGFSNNSIDLDDESCAAMIEMDTYTDETIYDSNVYGLPAKIHKPDLDEDETQLTADIIIGDYNSMMASVYTGTDSYLHQVDPDYLARYLLACECIVNNELCHPKSVYLYSENVTDGFNLNGDDDTPWVFGPLWDCDWAFGYSNSNYYINQVERDFFPGLLSSGTSNGVAGNFFNALRYNSALVDRIYYTLMYDFVNNGGLDELLDYCDEYYDFASASFEHNEESEASERDGADYAAITSNSKDWLDKRARFILSALTPYDIDDDEGDDDDAAPTDRMGDVNDDGEVGVADMVCILNYMLGIDNETFLAPRADINSDGEVSISDVVSLCDMIMAQVVDVNRNLHMPAADITLQMENTVCEKESVAFLPVNVCVEEGAYSALQMDLQLPDGVELDGLELPSVLSEMTVQTKLMDGGGKYRIVIYADGNHSLPEELVTIQLRLMTVEPISGYASITGASASTCQGEEERLTSVGCTFVVVDDITPVSDIKEDLPKSQEASDAVYDLSGRRVNSRQAARQRGVYIMKGRKVVR